MTFGETLKENPKSPESPDSRKSLKSFQFDLMGVTSKETPKYHDSLKSFQFDLMGVTSTATSALGDLLSKSTLLGAAAHSGVPSNTSRYFSVNVGLVHIAAIDLNHGILATSDQAVWLERDLAAVDRSITPWVRKTIILYYIIRVR